MAGGYFDPGAGAENPTVSGLARRRAGAEYCAWPAKLLDLAPRAAGWRLASGDPRRAPIDRSRSDQGERSSGADGGPACAYDLAGAPRRAGPPQQSAAGRAQGERIRQYAQARSGRPKAW